ncbi:MAG: helix-turn-helix domain-containing protein [Pseudomonadota bacterium]
MTDLKRQAELRQSIELFYFAYRAFTSRPDHILAGQGLGRAHHRILYFVGRHPNIAIHGLLDLLEVSKQALNAPLRHLIEKKLVSMNSAEHDKRFKQLQLTEIGKELEAQLTSTQMQHLAAAFDSTDRETEIAWRSIMKALPEKL